MTVSIPASKIVNVVPGVLDAGGTGLDLGGLFLTTSTRVPVGLVLAFASAAAVSSYFGGSATETALAETYFAGFDNSPIKPAALAFSQYPAVAVAAYVRGGKLGLTLSQLQAIASGTLAINVDGRAVTSASISLSSVTSFSNAASVIETAINDYAAVGTAAVAGTTMTVSAASLAGFKVGQVVEGANITPGTVITALGTGTGGAGTYTVSPSQTAASAAVKAGKTTVAYDSVSDAFTITSGTPIAGGAVTITTGAMATALKLNTADGAVSSPGAAAATPAGAMDAVAAVTQNFAMFSTTWEPTTNDGVAFAAWNASKGNRFAFVLWDTDVIAAGSSDTSSAAYLIRQAGYGGAVPVYSPINRARIAAFIMGTVASIDFTRVNGRTNMAFRAQAGLSADVTDETVAANLVANGYNFYGAYATANDRFVFLNPGSVTGDFAWLDSYINQIWLNNGFQLSLMTLLTNAPSIPYNDDGYALIEASMSDPIDAAVNFGAIRAGVALSNAQATAVNTAAGTPDAARTLELRGWYLKVFPASAEVRAARGSPPISFWYTDGQSVQQISLNSLEVQ